MQLQVAITKDVDFQGKLDEFSNVYTFTGVADTLEAQTALVDAVVAAERPIFSNAVRFVRARAWGGSGIAPTTMLVTKDLVGTGGVPDTGAMYRECALMIRWPLPSRTAAFATTSNTFRRVSRYLRKYLHTCVPHTYPTTGGGNGLVGAPNALLATYVATIKEPRPGALLCAPNGDTPTGDAQFSRWMEHRQFPRGRKE